MRLWTQDEDRQLRALVASRPKLSSTEIGRYMGRSRYSIIGYCNRIGLTPPKVARKINHKAPDRPGQRKPNGKPNPETWPPKPRPGQEPQERQALPTRFADLTAHQCRFPVADDEPGPLMACCGQRVAEPSTTNGMRASYCAECMKTMVRTINQKSIYSALARRIDQ